MFYNNNDSSKIRKYIILAVFGFLIVFHGKHVIAQDNLQNNRITTLSMEITHFQGYLHDINYEIYPNFGIRLFKSQKVELHSKIGFGLRMLFLEPALSSVQFYLEAYHGKERHFIVSGIGCMKVRKEGFHIPLIIGYKYLLNSKNSIMVQVNPILWSIYEVFDGYNKTDRVSEWIWDDFPYLGYGLRLGYYYHF
ncbi:MAG: hypothetical protein K8S16_09615 [Bacteroidales bacterium]|nr:hypothetical protein [Bacteroidales bacterium]